MINKVDEAIHAVSDHLKCLAESDVEQEFSRTEAIAKETEALEKLVASRAEFYKARYPKTEDDINLLQCIIVESCTILQLYERERNIASNKYNPKHIESTREGW